MKVEAGQRLTTKGLVQRELFVVLKGAFEVRDGDRCLRFVGPGEVGGEVGFFGTAEPRSPPSRQLPRGRC